MPLKWHIFQKNPNKNNHRNNSPIVRKALMTVVIKIVEKIAGFEVYTDLRCILTVTIVKSKT